MKRKLFNDNKLSFSWLWTEALVEEVSQKQETRQEEADSPFLMIFLSKKERKEAKEALLSVDNVCTTPETVYLFQIKESNQKSTPKSQ